MKKKFIRPKTCTTNELMDGVGHFLQRWAEVPQPDEPHFPSVEETKYILGAGRYLQEWRRRVLAAGGDWEATLYDFCPDVMPDLPVQGYWAAGTTPAPSHPGVRLIIRPHGESASDLRRRIKQVLDAVDDVDRWQKERVSSHKA